MLRTVLKGCVRSVKTYRKWLIGLAIAGLVLCITAWMTRGWWLLPKLEATITEALEGQMGGNWTVTFDRDQTTLWSAVSLTSLSGKHLEGPIADIACEEITVAWSLGDIWTHRDAPWMGLAELTIEQCDIVLSDSYQPPPPDPQSEDPDATFGPEELADLLRLSLPALPHDLAISTSGSVTAADWHATWQAEGTLAACDWSVTYEQPELVQMLLPESGNTSSGEGASTGTGKEQKVSQPTQLRSSVAFNR